MVHNLALSMLSEFGSELHLFVAWQCNGGMLSSFNAAANCFRRWESLSYNTSAITVSKEKTRISRATCLKLQNTHILSLTLATMALFWFITVSNTNKY